MFQISEKILLTFWVGSMWTVGYIVAPVLFNMLDKQTAGNVAGQLFTIVSYIGLLSSVVILAGQFYQHGLNINNWRIWALLVMLLVILLGQFVLQPMMVELKAAGLEGEEARQFGCLHGVSSVLFLINSLLGLALVVLGLQKQV